MVHKLLVHGHCSESGLPSVQKFSMSTDNLTMHLQLQLNNENKNIYPERISTRCVFRLDVLNKQHWLSNIFYERPFGNSFSVLLGSVLACPCLFVQIFAT